MPGPPPSPNSRRRGLGPEWKPLPRGGRAGRPPKYPLGRCSKQTRELWNELWATPQAAAWEALGWTRIVARYAMKLVLAELDEAPVTLQAEIRQLEDRLGLSPMAMKRLQWFIGDRPAEGEENDAEVAHLDAYRERLG